MNVKNLPMKGMLVMLRFYKREISPMLPPCCRYTPTCSEYAMQAVEKYGAVKWLAGCQAHSALPPLS